MKKELFENYGIKCVSSVIYYSYTKTSIPYPIQNKGRRHYGLVYSIIGCETYNFGDRSLTVPEGYIIFVPKNAVYEVTLEGESSTVISMDFEFEDEPPMTPFCLNIGNYAGIASLMSDAEQCYRTRKVGFEAECMAYFYKVIATLIRFDSETLLPSAYKKIESAVNYLHEHYTDTNFRISTLSEIAGINPKYFGILFHKKFGQTPKEYSLSLRIERAKELLCAEKCDIADVAISLGFSDVYHFTKTFKAAVGVPPGEYRASRQPHITVSARARLK